MAYRKLSYVAWPTFLNMRIPSVELLICFFSSVPSSFIKCLSALLNRLLPNFKIVFIKVTGMVTNQQTQLYKINFLFSSNPTWFLFWDFILPRRVKTLSINLRSLSPLFPLLFLGLCVSMWNIHNAKAWEGGAFILTCARSGLSVLAWSWSPSIITSLTGRVWFLCARSHLVWCLL